MRTLHVYALALAALLGVSIAGAGEFAGGPVAGMDLAARSSQALSLGLPPDPFIRLSMPAWDDLTCSRLGEPERRCGIPVSDRLPHQFALSAPLDLALEFQIPSEFCPGYWPRHEPEKTLADFCNQTYFDYWPLEQSPGSTPFATARDEVKHLNSNTEDAWRRAAAALVHWTINGGTAEAAGATILGALSGEDRLRNDIALELLTGAVLKVAPKSLWRVVPDETSVAADLRVSSSLSYNSAVSMSRMLRLAAERDIGAVVVADHGHVGGAQEARRLAEELQANGQLPPEFQVITGERIECLGGAITAVGIRYRIPQSMTLERTIREIHRQRGVAILEHPGELGGTDLVRRLDVDGYFIQPGLFELFRTLSVLYDPDLLDKPALYASRTPYAQGVGLPYSAVPVSEISSEAIVGALREREGYAASNLYFPVMGVLALRPIAGYERALNRYFVGHDWVTRRARELLGADHVIMATTWDVSVRNLMGFDYTLREWDRIRNGTSPLTRRPRVSFIAAQYGDVQVEYRRDSDEFWLRSRISF